MLAIGPQVMQLAFGDKFTYDRAGLAIVAVGMGFYLSAAALNQAALAQGQARRAAVCWVACAAGFVDLQPDPAARPLPHGRGRLRVCAAALSGLLYLLYRSPHPVAADEITPGSPRELEAQLAAVDEIG